MPPETTLTRSSQDQPLLERLSIHLVPELRRYLAHHRAAVEAQIAGGQLEVGYAAGQRYAKVYDGLLSALFHATRTAMLREGTWQPVSLAAVGSYGRGAVCPHSDLDVRLLCGGQSSRFKATSEALLYPLWDAGLSIGHQVVTIEEMVQLAREDLPTATSILDWRTIVGDSDLSTRLLERAFQGVFGPAGIGKFIERLEESTEGRHERFGGSVFLLEPDVKNGEGGLRDLDHAQWAARARWRVRHLSDLVSVGVIVRREWESIEAARAMLFSVRNLLHISSGRRTDRLSFEQQERVAAHLGYGKGGPAVERFMGDYYRHARALAQTREMIVARAKPPPRRPPRENHIGRGLKITRDAVSLVDPDALHSDPALALRLYDEAVRRNLPVYDFARHAIARAAASEDFCAKLRQSPEAAELFTRLVCVVQQTKLRHGSPLYDLHDAGLLVAMIPEFAPVIGRVHHDIYHVYTVDVHSVAAVNQLAALCRGDLAAEHPLASRLAIELPRPNVVFFATLLHDVGKDLGGRNHSERGAELAGDILKRLRFSPADIADIQHHVELHLKMYHVATRRDIDDPRTLAEFCSHLHGLEGLRELYLLTLADVTTTSPGSMTSWKRRMLDELYFASERFLSVGDGHDEARPEAVKEKVRALWTNGAESAFLEHMLSALPHRYLYANDPEAIVEQARFAERALSEEVSIGVLARDEPYVELCVIAEDRPGLLALIAATLSASKIKVLGAQVYSWVGQDGVARSLDMFWVRSGQESEIVERQVPRLEDQLRALVAGDLDPVEIAASKPQARWTMRSTPPVATKVNIDNRSATKHTVVEVITRDRPALLFWLSRALHQAGLSIALAKVNTEGERVADVFYVVDENKGKMDDRRFNEVREHIFTTIARLESGEP